MNAGASLPVFRENKINFFSALNELDRTGQEVKRKIIVMGQDTPVEKESALIGKCASPLWEDYDYLPGCPPKVAAIKEFVSARNITE